MLKKISCILIILGAISLIYWPKVYQEGFFIPLRYELIFLAAVLVFSIDFIKRFNRHITYSKEERDLYFILSIFIISIVAATIISYCKYDLTLNFIGATIFLKLLLGTAIFAMVYRLSVENFTFYKCLSLSLALPSLLLVPFILMPGLAEKWGMISYGNRFQGLTVNPSAMAMLAIIAFGYMCSFLVYYLLVKKNYLHMLFSLLATIGISMLIFWSQSRSYVFVMLIIAIAVVPIYSYCIKIKSIKTNTLKMISYFMMSISVLLIALSFIPSDVQQSFIYDRLLGTSTSLSPKNSMSALLNQTETENQASINKMATILSEDPRVTMWENYYPLLLFHHPFGIGINYYPQFSYKWFNTKHQENDLPPFFLFNVLALGGVISVGCICFLLWKSILKFKSTLPFVTTEHIPYKIGAMLALSTFWLMSIFNGLSIDYIGFWIVFSLALV